MKGIILPPRSGMDRFLVKDLANYSVPTMPVEDYISPGARRDIERGLADAAEQHLVVLRIAMHKQSFARVIDFAIRKTRTMDAFQPTLFGLPLVMQDDEEITLVTAPTSELA